jgi:hypothetical protein
LQAEGIFRINPENGHEGFVREQLNKGIVPSDEIDVHALASLIKVSLSLSLSPIFFIGMVVSLFLLGL